MTIEEYGAALSPLTTMRVGGPAARLVTVTTTDELVDAVREVDDAEEPLLVVGGGSNVVIADAGFAGTVVRVATSGVARESQDACGGAFVRVAAGENWDDFVAGAIAERWTGVEALSGIPGSVGATPIQNVGAYGQEVAQTIAQVRTWDRQAQAVKTFTALDCRFTYRHSIFKGSPFSGSGHPVGDAAAARGPAAGGRPGAGRSGEFGAAGTAANAPDVPAESVSAGAAPLGATGRYVVLEVVFQFVVGDLSRPVGYQALASGLGVEMGARVPMADAREAVLEQRRRRGMVLDAADHDTWSCGSFFTNPQLGEAAFGRLTARAAEVLGAGAEVPRYAGDAGSVKTSAAWLIERAGFGKGYGLAGEDGLSGRAGLSTKHTLAVTNRGDAKAADVLALAARVRDGVRDRFGVTLVNEPVLVGLDL